MSITIDLPFAVPWESDALKPLMLCTTVEKQIMDKDTHTTKNNEITLNK
jgi:hypothetical protein